MVTATTLLTSDATASALLIPRKSPSQRDPSHAQERKTESNPEPRSYNYMRFCGVQCSMSLWLSTKVGSIYLSSGWELEASGYEARRSLKLCVRSGDI